MSLRNLLPDHLAATGVYTWGRYAREIVRVRGVAGGNTVSGVADPVTVAVGVVVSTLSLELDETAVVVAVAVGRAE